MNKLTSADYLAGTIVGLLLTYGSYHVSLSFDRKHVVLSGRNFNSLSDRVVSVRNKPNPRDLPSKNYYGWWLCSRGTCRLFQFISNDFVSGVIQACDQAGVDFRDYARGPPFKVEGGRIVNYQVKGYDIRPYQRRNLATPMALYNYTYEFNGDYHDEI